MVKLKKFHIFILITTSFFFIFAGLGYSFRLDKSIIIELDQNKIINSNFYGFGAETLPWLWTKENLKQGINENDIKLNFGRIREIELPLTRIFVPWEIWNPAADYKTFTFDSDGMQSLCKTLDIYQGMGTRVIIVTVDWLRDSPWYDVKKSSGAVLKLLECLVKRKGYSCIHFWTLTNEPELTYGWLKKIPFKNYIQIHKLVKEGLKEKKIPIEIIGSDDIESKSWFKDSVEFLFDLADVFSSHMYLYPDEIESISTFCKDRINIINNKTKTAMLKPFFICEFGFRGPDFSSHNNSLMKSFDYGLLSAELCIDALNSGVSGVSIWCLHEILMPDGKKMNIGLWGYKDEDWWPRPVFYAYSLFTKYVKQGSRVIGIKNQGHSQLKTSCIEYGNKKSIFVLNKSNLSRKIIINGLDCSKPLKRYLYSSKSVPTKDQHMLKFRLIKFKDFLKDKIPPQSLVLYTSW